MERKSNLSCREAELILKAMSPTKCSAEMNTVECGACEHYSQCQICLRRGLAEISGHSISHQEALELLARKPGPQYSLFQSQIETIREKIAVEHIFGRRVITRPNCVESDYGACTDKQCVALHYHWILAPLCSHYDGEKELAEQIPLTINLFQEAGWPLENLLNIQRERASALLQAILSNEGPRNRHLLGLLGYSNNNDAVREIEEHLQSLQKLLISLQSAKASH